MTIFPRSMIVMARPAALKQAELLSRRGRANCKRFFFERNNRDWSNLRQRVEKSIGAVVKSQNFKLDLN
jgi:hypothetical protein